jgi:hypothetical protein
LVAVEEIGETRRAATVYNLRVSEWHTYFVGSRESDLSVWAHNADYADSIPKAAFAATTAF